MKVFEIINNNKGKYDEVEVYAYKDETHRMHAEFVENIDEIYNSDQYSNSEAVNYEIMDENEYNNSVGGKCADFAEMYDNREAKVLVIFLAENWNEEIEALEEVTPNKLKMAELLIELPGFDGEKDATFLCEHYSEDELYDILETYDIEFSDPEYEGTELEITEGQKQNIQKYLAQDKYDKANTQRFSIKLNKNTDVEIIEWLNRQPSKQGAIKSALKKAMNEETT